MGEGGKGDLHFATAILKMLITSSQYNFPSHIAVCRQLFLKFSSDLT